MTFILSTRLGLSAFLIVAMILKYASSFLTTQQHGRMACGHFYTDT